MTPTQPVFIKATTGNTRPVTFAKDQPEYIALPAEVTPDGMVTTRWRLSIRERLQLLFSGSLWVQTLTFNEPLQPIKLSTEEPEAH